MTNEITINCRCIAQPHQARELLAAVMRMREKFIGGPIIPDGFFRNRVGAELPSILNKRKDQSDMLINVQPFRHVYRTLLKELMNSPTEKNTRTGVHIRVIPGAVSFKVDASEHIPLAGNRRYWPHIAAAETAWQVLGTRDPEFILRRAPKLWSKFVEDGILKTAYGWRWREAFGRDQLGMAIEALAEDPTNRQVYVQAWDPRSDGLGEPNQPKNIPCPVGFSVSIVEGELHMSVFIRSSDVFVGLPYDVMCYALTLDAIAASVGVRPGTLHVTLSHAHIYEPHWEATDNCIRGAHSEWDNLEVPLPAWPVHLIQADPDGYVEQVHRHAKRVDQTSWDPQPILVG